MPIEVKACKNCGKVEAMGLSCDLCLLCRIKKQQQRAAEIKRRYYEKNREKILEKAKIKKIAAKSKDGKLFEIPKTKKVKWTVEFIKEGGRFSWRAWFRNPATERLVKFESSTDFCSLLSAQDDYRKATR